MILGVADVVLQQLVMYRRLWLPVTRRRRLARRISAGARTNRGGPDYGRAVRDEVLLASRDDGTLVRHQTRFGLEYDQATSIRPVCTSGNLLELIGESNPSLPFRRRPSVCVVVGLAMPMHVGAIAVRSLFKDTVGYIIAQ